jgi:ABC-type multidrug transport system fused ATPase/permease subunit
LEFFDEVYVIENGVVVEQGNPKELMNGKGPLGGLWKAYRANNDTIAQN